MAHFYVDPQTLSVVYRTLNLSKLFRGGSVGHGKFQAFDVDFVRADFNALLVVVLEVVNLVDVTLQSTKNTTGPVHISRRAGFERLCACGKASIFVEEIERLEVVGRALSQTAQSFQVILPRSTLLPDRPAPGEAGVFDDVPVRIRGQAARLCRLMQKRVAHVVRVLRVTARPAPPQRTKATKRPSTRTESRRSESRSAKVHPKKLLVERDL